MVQGTGRGRAVADPALGWSHKLSVEVGGPGTVAHAGVVLPRLLADRVGLTQGLAQVVARADFTPVRHRGRLLVDAACALATGATGLSDVEALTRQVELFGPGGGASDTTVLRGLDELADRLGGDGLPGRRLARAMARARAKAWAAIIDRHGGLPAVRVAGSELRRRADGGQGQQDEQDEQRARGRPVVVVRLDATVIHAVSDKDGAEPNFKGYGFHPLTAWCSNVGDNLAVMLRPGSAGSFTAADHIAVLDAAIGQVPADWRTDLLVTVDGAGFSHALIDHLTALNTARTKDGGHGARGRRVEYSIGWPVDARTKAAIEALRECDWSTGLGADGRPDLDTEDKVNAQVADLTGLLRHAVADGKADVDLLDSWPEDLRVIARRTPRQPNEQAELGQDAQWRYGAFATNTTTGQVQWLDARHRTQAHVEDFIKDTKACGATRLPSKDYDRNAAWLQLAALAVSLNAWLKLIALDGDLAKAEPKALRFRLLAAPARMVTHARNRILKIPPGWAWAPDLTNAWDRLHALHPA